jgi:hypothetical protein
MNKWRQISVRENITRILAFLFVIKGKIPFVNTPVDNTLRVYGNILLLPVMVFFIINMALVARNKIPTGRRLLYILAGIGVPLCIMILTVAGGNYPPMRSILALPLASAFMFFFLIKAYKKKVAAVVACLALLTAAHQAQISAQLYYSDQMRYNEDVRLAYELNDLIIRTQPANRKLPVALVGKYPLSSRFHTNFLQAEMIGGSVFSRVQPYETNTHGLDFMKSLGINFDIPSEKQIDQAIKEAASMPVYPDPGCVKRMRDFIVVRMSETMY